jgi:hypothetical protein
VGGYLIALASLVVVGVVSLIYRAVTFAPSPGALYGSDAEHILGGAIGAVVAVAWLVPIGTMITLAALSLTSTSRFVFCLDAVALGLIAANGLRALDHWVQGGALPVDSDWSLAAMNGNAAPWILLGAGSFVVLIVMGISFVQYGSWALTTDDAESTRGSG